MSYNISSHKLKDPLLKPILKDLLQYFTSTNVKFFIIGATARDIIMDIHGEKSGRATNDLDIAIAISDWKKYKIIEEGIIKIAGFKKDKLQKQRFIYREKLGLDIVPFGDIMTKNDKIFWPPDEQLAMSVLGFDEVSRATLTVRVDNDITINIASLAGIFILKIIAWQDRKLETNKDADDIGFIINNYLNINAQRAGEDYYEQIYLDENFSTICGGAKLLGIDVAKILQTYPETKEKILKLIETEIQKEEESKLINQIIETHTNFEYEIAMNCFTKLLDGLKNY